MSPTAFADALSALSMLPGLIAADYAIVSEPVATGRRAKHRSDAVRAGGVSRVNKAWGIIDADGVNGRDMDGNTRIRYTVRGPATDAERRLLWAAMLYTAESATHFAVAHLDLAPGAAPTIGLSQIRTRFEVLADLRAR